MSDCLYPACREVARNRGLCSKHFSACYREGTLESFALPSRLDEPTPREREAIARRAAEARARKIASVAPRWAVVSGNRFGALMKAEARRG